MNRPGLVFSLLAVGAIAAAPKAVIVGKEKVEAGRPIWLDGSKSTYDAKYPPVWSHKGPRVTLHHFDEGGRQGLTVFVEDPPAGVYEFKLKVKGVPEGETEVDADCDVFTVTVGTPTPLPPAPAPPPTPTPLPPAPPTPAPAPQSEVTDRLRVLVLYETSEWLTIDQYEALRSDEVRSYLNSHAMSEPNKTAAWRFWDKDMTVAATEPPAWKEVLAAARAKLGTAATAAPFTPTIFAFKDTLLLDAIPIKDMPTTMTFLHRFGGH
jgi:hypothetical protein